MPLSLKLREVKNEKKMVADFYLTAKDKQQRYNFNMRVLAQSKADIMVVSHGKCAYCESLLSTAGGEISHFRPKSIYWWLAYEWRNLFVTCPDCIRHKSNLFPAKNQFVIAELAGKSISELNRSERPLLLDPCIDFPHEHLTYEVNKLKKTVMMLSQSERGKITIQTLGLNRQQLQENRFKVYSDLEKFINQYLAIGHTSKINISRVDKIRTIAAEDDRVEFSLEKVVNFMHVSSLYAGMSRFFLGEFSLANPSNGALKQLLNHFGIPVKESVAEITMPPDQHPKSSIEESLTMTINRFIPTEIEINNFKSISNLKLTFRTLEENTKYAKEKFPKESDIDKVRKESWIMLLGENGVGKSSVLQAIVLTLLPPAMRKLYLGDPVSLVRSGQEKGFIKITVGLGEPIELHFDNKGNINGNIRVYEDYLLAYGATRLLPKGKLVPESTPGKIKVENLFDYSIAMENAEDWLLNLNDADFDQAALFLKDLLFLQNNLSRKDRKIFTSEYGTLLELKYLSDGYKTLLALAVDMMKTFATQETDARYTDIQKYASGIVLIDEIGTHLHPRWKMQIVERLRAALPKVFFIVTSHEPLCLRGLRDKEIVVLQRIAETNEIMNVDDLPSIEGLRVDQLLTSKFFGLKSTIDPAIEKKFDRYYELLTIPDIERTVAHRAEIDTLQQELKSMNQLGDSLREELFYYVVDEVAAKKIKEHGMKTKDELKQEVKKKVEDLLLDIDLSTSS
jgi:uncharacterized protein (TIGR02646 family)